MRRRIDMPEGKVFKLDAQAIDPDPARQWCIDFERLGCDPLALVRLWNVIKRPHVMKPVAQFDDQDTDIGRNRHDQFLEVLGLLGSVGAQLHLPQLGDAIHQGGNFGRKKFAQLFERRRRIFDCVMQQARTDRGRVHLQICQNHGHRSNMRKIRLAGIALLRRMHFPREIVSAMNQIGINGRIIFGNTPDEIVGGWVGLKRRMIKVWRGEAHPALEPVVWCAVAITLQRFEHVGFIRVNRSRLGRDLRKIILRRCALFFFLITRNDALQAVDEAVFQRVKVEITISNFAQGHDRVFVVVAVERQLGTGRDIPGAVRSQQNEIKTVRNFLDTIFNGDAGHTCGLL